MILFLIYSLFVLLFGVLLGFLIGRQNPIFAAKTALELEAAYEAAKRKLGLKP